MTVATHGSTQDKPKTSRTEQIICVLIAGCLGSLGALLLWDVRRPARSPFATEAALISQGSRSPDLLAAEYLLPEQPAAAVRRTSQARSITLEELKRIDAALADAARNYKVRTAYTADYTTGQGQVRATVLEMAGPEWAFGLWTARQPRNSQKIRISTSGQAWLSDSAAAFWAGKYYVEVRARQQPTNPSQSPADVQATSVRQATTSMRKVITALAEGYLFYGRPFEAEMLLEAAGLQVKALTFTPQPAFGFESLRPAFIAECQDGLEVAMSPQPSPEAAEAALRSLPTDPSPIRPGIFALKATPGAITVVTTIGNYIVAIRAKQREAPAEIARKLALIAGTPGKGRQPAQSITTSVAASREILPQLQNEDLKGPSATRTFTADTLYEKIDGRAELYLSYGFAELKFATYTGPDGLALDVYLYDMADVANAFGIYKAEESEYGEPVEIGRAGYKSASGVFFWKDRYYVNVLINKQTDRAEQIALELARAIAGRIKDSGKPLWGEQLLPKEARVPGSLEFYRRDAFGLDFLTDVYAATYEVNGQEVTLFIMDAGSPQRAAEVFGKYKTFSQKYGKIIQDEEKHDYLLLVADSGGTYDVVFATGNFVGGANSAEDLDAARKLVQKWLRTLLQNRKAAMTR